MSVVDTEPQPPILTFQSKPNISAGPDLVSDGSLHNGSGVFSNHRVGFSDARQTPCLCSPALAISKGILLAQLESASSENTPRVKKTSPGPTPGLFSWNRQDLRHVANVTVQPEPIAVGSNQVGRAQPAAIPEMNFAESEGFQIGALRNRDAQRPAGQRMIGGIHEDFILCRCCTSGNIVGVTKRMPGAKSSSSRISSSPSGGSGYTT